jgi:hypothetical protein
LLVGLIMKQDLKKDALCDVTPRGSCKNLRLLVTANVPSSPFVILMMEAIRSSETSVLKKVRWRNIIEDGILHRHHRQSPKSYETRFDLLLQSHTMDPGLTY